MNCIFGQISLSTWNEKYFDKFAEKIETHFMIRTKVVVNVVIHYDKVAYATTNDVNNE